VSQDFDEKEIRAIDNMIEKFQIPMRIAESRQGELRSGSVMIAGRTRGLVKFLHPRRRGEA